MGQWVVTVVGIAVLSVLCDVILPEGQTRKYIKTVFGVVVTLVIVQPVVGLFASETSFETGEVSLQVQQQYLSNAEERQLQIAADTVTDILIANGVAADRLECSAHSVTAYISSPQDISVEQKVRKILQLHFPDKDVHILWENTSS